MSTIAKLYFPMYQDSELLSCLFHTDFSPPVIRYYKVKIKKNSININGIKIPKKIWNEMEHLTQSTTASDLHINTQRLEEIYTDYFPYNFANKDYLEALRLFISTDYEKINIFVE